MESIFPKCLKNHLDKVVQNLEPTKLHHVFFLLDHKTMFFLVSALGEVEISCLNPFYGPTNCYYGFFFERHFWFLKVHSLKPTSTLKMGHPKRNFIFKPSIFRFYVSFRCGYTLSLHKQYLDCCFGNGLR